MVYVPCTHYERRRQVFLIITMIMTLMVLSVTGQDQMLEAGMQLSNDRGLCMYLCIHRKTATHTTPHQAQCKALGFRGGTQVTKSSVTNDPLTMLNVLKCAETVQDCAKMS